jgi:hypothetical protein
MELTVSVIDTGVHKIGKYIIGVGSTNKLANGKSHLLGDKTCKDISEVASGYAIINYIAVFDFVIL